MPSPNQIFTELVTTTFRNHRTDIIDNVSNDWIAFPQKNDRRKGSAAKPKSPK